MRFSACTSAMDTEVSGSCWLLLIPTVVEALREPRAVWLLIQADTRCLHVSEKSLTGSHHDFRSQDNDRKSLTHALVVHECAVKRTRVHVDSRSWKEMNKYAIVYSFLFYFSLNLLAETNARIANVDVAQHKFIAVEICE